RNALFTLKHAESFAELEFVSVESSDIGGGLTRLRVALKNRGVMPTDSGMAVSRRVDTPVRVSVRGATLVSAGLSDETWTNVRLQRGRLDHLQIPRIRPEATEYAELIVRTRPGAALSIAATHPRAVNAEAPLK